MFETLLRIILWYHLHRFKLHSATNICNVVNFITDLLYQFISKMCYNKITVLSNKLLNRHSPNFGANYMSMCCLLSVNYPWSFEHLSTMIDLRCTIDICRRLCWLYSEHKLVSNSRLILCFSHWHSRCRVSCSDVCTHVIFCHFTVSLVQLATVH